MGRMELTVSVHVVVMVVWESGELACPADGRALVNSTKNGTGAIALGIGTLGSHTVVVAGVSGGDVDVGP